jgi:hypothetical protein
MEEIIYVQHKDNPNKFGEIIDNKFIQYKWEPDNVAEYSKRKEHRKKHADEKISKLKIGTLIAITTDIEINGNFFKIFEIISIKEYCKLINKF